MAGFEKNIFKTSRVVLTADLNKNFSVDKNNEKSDHPIFTKSVITNDKYSSKLRYDRPYLLSTETAQELNTYLSFSPFATFNDVYEIQYESTTKNNKTEISEKDNTSLGTPGTRSIFNKSGAVIIGSSTGNFEIDITQGDANNTSEWRISNNVPLMDSPEARKRIRKNSGCSVKELVQASQEGLLGRETYAYSDFMYCKYLGRMSNNYMVTLRRFPLPVDDYISSIGEASRTNKNITSQNVTCIGCLVTWMGTPGNDMNNILAYSYHMPYKSEKADWERVDVDADSSAGALNGIAAAFDPVYRKQYMNSNAGDAFNAVINKYFNNGGLGGPHYTAREFLNFRDKNKVYGPIDAIKETYMRDGQEGLSFNQEITLTFDYELRSYNGINTRQAMLDLLSNILNVTYTTGTFWGGGYRGGGAHQNNIFTNMNIFKPAGGMMDYVQHFYQDLTGLWGKQSPMGQKLVNVDWKNPSTWIDAIKQVGQGIGSMINQAGGMLIAGLLNKWGRPQKALVNSLLSPAPIGLWHITVGNPNHPIMSMGNMILTDTKIEHYGPLGLDDFPTGLKVTCTLTRGKPRDIRDIEKLYMHGNDRIYSSMGPKVFDMYEHASEYKNQYQNKATGNADGELTTIDTEINSVQNKKNENIQAAATNSKIPEVTNLTKITPKTFSHYNYKEMNNVLKKYFGHTDTYSIYVAAAEQEYGSDDKKPSKKQDGPASGDSRDRKHMGGLTTAQYY